MYMVYNLNNLKLSTNPTVSSQNPLLPYIAPSGPNSLMTEAKGAPSTHLRSFSSDSVVSLAMDACSSSSCQRGWWQRPCPALLCACSARAKALLTITAITRLFKTLLCFAEMKGIQGIGRLKGSCNPCKRAMNLCSGIFFFWSHWAICHARYGNVKQPQHPNQRPRLQLCRVSLVIFGISTPVPALSLVAIFSG